MAESQFPPPKILSYPASTPPSLISQGAEGRLYKTTYLLPDLPCALKYRPPKPYRHPVLDARLTRARILAEARVLARCRREGVGVPTIYAIDEAAGWLMMEWVEGVPVRSAINDWLGERPKNDGADDLVVAPGSGADAGAGVSAGCGATPGTRDQTPLARLMGRIGTAVGKMHRVGVVHGDLTTSNMMLRPWAENSANGNDRAAARIFDGDIVLIDFGLATQSTSDEDRAVDLYVLERAFGSTHPRAEAFFDEVLRAYRQTFKQAGQVLRKLEDVRMRGRKRSMIG